MGGKQTKMKGLYEVSWQECSTNRTSCLKDMYKQNKFVDVTLVLDDDQIEAHKVVIASASSFFQRVLERNHHPHPMLYLRGIQKDLFSSILDFIYAGEVSVLEGEFDKFMNIAKDLQIRGLYEDVSKKIVENEEDENIKVSLTENVPIEAVEIMKEKEVIPEKAKKKNKTLAKENSLLMQPQEETKTETVKEEKPPEKNVCSSPMFESEVKVDEDTGDYDLSVPESAEMYSKVKALLVTTPDGFWVCKKCRYGSKSKTNVMEHIESHVDGISHRCKFCLTKVFSKRTSLKYHQTRCLAARTGNNC